MTLGAPPVGGLGNVTDEDLRQAEHLAGVSQGAEEAAFASSGGWELLYEHLLRGGELGCVRLYRRAKKKLYEYFTCGRVKASALSLYLVNIDAQDRTNWDQYTVSMTVTPRDGSDTDAYVHSQSKFPSPLWDRDYCYHRICRASESAFLIVNKSCTLSSVPEDRSLVRVTDFESCLAFLPDPQSPGEWCELRQIYYDDPRGWIPAAALNHFLSRGVPGFIEQLLGVASARRATAAHP